MGLEAMAQPVFTDLPEGHFLFSSESVNEGHPDKLCDQVSDAILDACLKDDPMSRVACETCTKTGLVMVFGEITTKSKVNYEEVVRDTLKQIGYDDAAKGIDYKSCTVMVEYDFLLTFFFKLILNLDSILLL